MTKNEFMRELAGMLSRISEEERKYALQYYEDYFADAGITDEMIVPESLGTPRQVADKIIGDNSYEKTYDSYEKKADAYNKTTYDRNYDSHNRTNNAYGKTTDISNRRTAKTQKDNTNLVILIVVLVATFPVWTSACLAIGGTLIGLTLGAAGALIGLAIAGTTLIITAFMSGSLAGSILLAGIGMILIAVAILLFIALYSFFGRFIPWLVKQIKGLENKVLGKRGKTT